MALTPKQELFAQGVASGKTQADSYRAAYSAENMKDEAIWIEGSRLMADPNVTLRVNELREPAVKAVAITLENHLTALQNLRNAAADAAQYSAAITAEVNRGKASGLYTDKVENTHMNPDGSNLDLVINFVSSPSKNG